MKLCQPWESTDLVVRTVFKTAEAVARRLVGSIPTLSRHYTTNATIEKLHVSIVSHRCHAATLADVDGDGAIVKTTDGNVFNFRLGRVNSGSAILQRLAHFG